MLKADAYGHGAVPIGHALEEAAQPPDGFAVATFDEAVELREAGLELPILVLFPVPPERAAEAARRRIALAAGDLIGLECGQGPLQPDEIAGGQGDPPSSGLGSPLGGHRKQDQDR